LDNGLSDVIRANVITPIMVESVTMAAAPAGPDGVEVSEAVGSALRPDEAQAKQDAREQAKPGIPFSGSATDIRQFFLHLKYRRLRSCPHMIRSRWLRIPAGYIGRGM
jgi:hypothetical protein